MSKADLVNLFRWSLVWWMAGAIGYLPGGVIALHAESQSALPVILISVDTLRADHLSSYGYRGPRTPHIDAMARGGTLFSEVSAQVPLTLPSHVSIFTSTYPFWNGVEDNGQQLAPGGVTLATVLKSRNYATAAFVGGFVLDRRFGLNQGFDIYDSPFDLHRHPGVDPGDIKRLGEDVVRAATEWLEKNCSRPFFLFIHLYDLHTPYNLPPAARARFRSSAYDGELEYVDEVLGHFWNFLAERKLLERSLIVFTSDHGESLGEHGEGTHGYFIYQSTLRVPLIIHWPAPAGPFPARVEEPASLLDVAPTIVQFLGVARPPQFQGRSLIGLLKDASANAREEVSSESLYPRNHFGASALASLRLGRYKYIHAPKPEFFDLAQDPSETHNLYGLQNALAVTFRERLLSLRSRYRAEHPVGLQAPSPEAVARLSSLGYVALSGPRSVSPWSGPDPKARIADFEKYGRAIILASSGRLREAIALLENLLTKDPGLIDVRNSLGINLQRGGQHEKAIQNFREILKREPRNVLAHFNLGVSYYKLRQLDQATRELEATLVLAPYYTRAEELLGTIWLEKKDYERARANFTHLLTVAPNDYAAHYNLGVLATLEGRWEDGERHLRLALGTDPEAAEAHNTLGSLYLRRGDLGPARREFAEAIRLEPNFAWAHYNLGLVLGQQKRGEEAAREFRRALSADPQFRAARDALDRLEQLEK